jgi:protein SCO1/2
MLALATLPAHATEPSPTDRAALEASQGAIGRPISDHAFVNQDGRAFRFSDLRGKPVLVSIVYTSCYYVCSGLTVHLRDVVDVARDALGPSSFTVLTVGFDTANDTPSRMRMFAAERNARRPGWYFASADQPTIDRLASEVGFTYRPSAKGFDHITQTTVVDATGRVRLQVYGDDFRAPQLVDPLKRLLRGESLQRGTLDGLIESARLFCTIYDPASGRYRFDYSLVVEFVAGIFALGMMATAIVLAARNVR